MYFPRCTISIHQAWIWSYALLIILRPDWRLCWRQLFYLSPTTKQGRSTIGSPRMTQLRNFQPAQDLIFIFHFLSKHQQASVSKSYPRSGLGMIPKRIYTHVTYESKWVQYIKSYETYFMQAKHPHLEPNLLAEETMQNKRYTFGILGSPEWTWVLFRGHPENL